MDLGLRHKPIEYFYGKKTDHEHAPGLEKKPQPWKKELLPSESRPGLSASGLHINASHSYDYYEYLGQTPFRLFKGRISNRLLW